MKTEKALAVIFLISLALKLCDVPGASLLLSFDLLLMTLLYFPFCIYFFSDKTFKQQNVIFTLIGGLALAVAPLATLFRLMFWPGAGLQLLGGLVFALTTAIVSFILLKRSDDYLKTYYKNYLLRSVFWFVICLLFCCITSRQLLEVQYRNDPEMVKLKIDSYEHPNDPQYQEALNAHYLQRDSLQLIKDMKK